MGGNEWDIEMAEQGINSWKGKLAVVEKSSDRWERAIKLSHTDYKELEEIKAKIRNRKTEPSELWKLIDREIVIIEKYAKDRYGEIDLARGVVLIEKRW